MHRTLFCLFIFSVSCAADAQESNHSKNKGTLYGGMGFHRVFFTNSDIRFHDTKTANYDFTLYKVKAKDDNNFLLGQGIDAPQYSVRIGYLFNNQKGLGVEFSFDHVKYIATQDQKVHLKGQINGKSMDMDTILSSSFIEYE